MVIAALLSLVVLVSWLRYWIRYQLRVMGGTYVVTAALLLDIVR